MKKMKTKIAVTVLVVGVSTLLLSFKSNVYTHLNKHSTYNNLGSSYKVLFYESGVKLEWKNQSKNEIYIRVTNTGSEKKVYHFDYKLLDASGNLIMKGNMSNSIKGNHSERTSWNDWGNGRLDNVAIVKFYNLDVSGL
jgi:hypothetical protein